VRFLGQLERHVDAVLGQLPILVTALVANARGELGGKEAPVEVGRRRRLEAFETSEKGAILVVSPGAVPPRVAPTLEPKKEGVGVQARRVFLCLRPGAGAAQLQVVRGGWAPAQLDAPLLGLT